MSVGRFPRPTLRCLLDDLGYKKVPPAKEPLDRLQDAVLVKAAEVARAAPEGATRIVELDDCVFWKVKIERWRGALWTQDKESWLAAAGYRRDGDADDAYAELGERARRWKAEYNRDHSVPLTSDAFTGPLLPTENDYDRIKLEDSLRVVDDLRAELKDLTVAAAKSGREERGEAAGCELGMLIRPAGVDEVYVCVRIVSRTPDGVFDVHALVLDSVPAVADREGWFMDPMPDRDPIVGEIGWSNMVDRAALQQLTDGAERRD